MADTVRDITRDRIYRVVDGNEYSATGEIDMLDGGDSSAGLAFILDILQAERKAIVAEIERMRKYNYADVVDHIIEMILARGDEK